MEGGVLNGGDEGIVGLGDLVTSFCLHVATHTSKAYQ